MGAKTRYYSRRIKSNLAGPGNNVLNPHGTTTGVPAAVAATAFVWAPGWTFLGATYNASWSIPVSMFAAGSPVNVEASGMINTFIAPVELSWKLGASGFHVKTGLGMYVPDGTVTGVNGLGNVGNAWWTFMPEFVVSYLKDGWNLTANIYDEINTKSTVTQYRSGDILHAEFTATKTIGKWTFGPVAYYAGQVSDDRSSAFYGGAINVNRYDIWASSHRELVQMNSLLGFVAVIGSATGQALGYLERHLAHSVVGQSRHSDRVPMTSGLPT